MAGRLPVEHHRGHPPKLGRPEPGLLRRLTTNEVVVSGLTIATLVLGAPEGAFVLFKSIAHGPKVMYRALEYDDNQRAYNDLRRFWSEERT